MNRVPPRSPLSAGLNLEPLEARENPAALYVVPGATGTATALDFGWLERGGAFFSEIGVYTVDNASGAVGGVAPTDANYAQAALASATPVFTRGQAKGARSIQSFAAGTVLGFYMVQNSTLATARAFNPANAPINGPVVFFSFAGASPDQFDHAQGSASASGTVVRFEDGLYGGDRDFNDAVIRVQAINPNLVPGTAGQVSPSAFRLNRRDAGTGEIGVYAFDDGNGTVDGVRPGDPGYAAAVLRSAKRTVLFSPSAGAGTIAGANLPATGTFGFYMIQGVSAETFLQVNPTNMTGFNLPVMFFSQSNANPDSTVHVRQGANTLYFENGLNGGDQDFNDAVVSFVYGAPISVPTPAPTNPTISAIADQTIYQDLPTPALAFTVGGGSVQPSALTVTATSSNQTLLPDANITLGGTGANRTITVTPAANQTGTATITLTVSDGTRTTTATFNVTVLPGTPPTFTATNPPTANFNAGLQTVANFATFVPGTNGGTTPTYTVRNVSNPGLFSGTPTVSADGTLTYTAVAGGFGSSTFEVVVSDGVTTSAAQTFTIQVSPVQGVSPTVIPGTTIDLADSRWRVIPTVVPSTNSAGIPAGTVADGTRILDTVVGNGATVARGNQVTVAYIGYLLNGTIFDQNTSAQFTALETSLIPGFAAGLIGMQVGGTRYIDIPSYLAYGSSSPSGAIPANARLIFQVTVNSIP